MGVFLTHRVEYRVFLITREFYPLWTQTLFITDAEVFNSAMDKRVCVWQYLCGVDVF